MVLDLHNYARNFRVTKWHGELNVAFNYEFEIYVCAVRCDSMKSKRTVQSNWCYNNPYSLEIENPYINYYQSK